MATLTISHKLIRRGLATPLSTFSQVPLKEDSSPHLNRPQLQRCFAKLLGNFSSKPSFSAPLRLRRPLRFAEQTPQTPQNQRPHAITLFPGDFSDDVDPWEDDDDEPYDNQGDLYEKTYTRMATSSDEDDPTARMLEELQRREREQQLKKERWLQNSIPPVRVPVIDERGRAYGRGGRKTAQARVWIQAGFGQVVVNRRPLEEYFIRLTDRDLVLQPMVATETCGKWDVTAIVRGGGLTGQAGAIRHGLANALNAYDPDRYRPALKALGFLTRDARKVERKKIGHIKARKSPQWVRR